MMIDLWVWFKDTASQSVGLASAFCPFYLIIAAAYSLVWWIHEQGATGVGIRTYLGRLWQKNRRAIAIDGLWVVGQLVFLRTPIAWVHIALFDFFYEALMKISVPFTFEAPIWIEGLLTTGLTMLAIDGTAYLVHRALHGLPVLWIIHRVHHSATFLTPLSTFRQNPLEPLLLNGARGIAAGIALGGLHLVLPQATPVWTIGGMGLGFFLYMFTVNLHHAPLPIRYPRALRLILISPHVHHIHHSAAPEHFDRNFGVIFSIWDRWFGTYHEQDIGLDELQFGLAKENLGS